MMPDEYRELFSQAVDDYPGNLTLTIFLGNGMEAERSFPRYMGLRGQTVGSITINLDNEVEFLVVSH